MAELRPASDLDDPEMGSRQWLALNGKGDKNQKEANSGVDNPAFHDHEVSAEFSDEAWP